jgi:nucleoside-diphosphate-sugar epimerase
LAIRAVNHQARGPDVADTTLIGLSGESGLFGSAILSNLPQEIRISGMINLRSLPTVEIFREVEKLAKLGSESFLHLAWPASSSLSNYRFSEENFEVLQKTIILQDACMQTGINFIGIGSVLDKVSTVENYYHLAKFACRQMLKARILDETITWIRPYYVFNDDSWPEFIYATKNLPVIIFNDSPRDFIHLDDVVTGIIEIISHKIKGEIDLGCGIMTKPSDLCTVLGKGYSIELDGHAAHLNNHQLSSQPHSILSHYWAPNKTLELLKGKNDHT